MSASMSFQRFLREQIVAGTCTHSSGRGRGTMVRGARTGQKGRVRTRDSRRSPPLKLPALEPQDLGNKRRRHRQREGEGWDVLFRHSLSMVVGPRTSLARVGVAHLRETVLGSLQDFELPAHAHALSPAQ